MRNSHENGEESYAWSRFWGLGRACFKTNQPSGRARVRPAIGKKDQNMQIKRQLQAALVSEAILLLAATNGTIAHGQQGNKLDPAQVMAAAGQSHAPNNGLPPGRSNYQFTAISLPDNTQILAGPTDNDALTGYYLDDVGFAHGFVWSKGVLSELDALGQANTVPAGINDAGVVIGNYDDTVTVHGFLYRIADQSWSLLPDIPGKPLIAPSGISDNGLAVGTAYEGDISNPYAEVGWIWDGKSYSLFTVPGAASFAPIAINNMGQVVGYYPEDPANPFGPWHGFIKNGKTITTIDVPVPGTRGTFPVGINNNGDIAGTYYGVYAGTFEVHGFILHKGEFVTVDYPETSVTEVWGINNRGQLSAFVALPSGLVPFLATPSPGSKP
jgi:hypothetical protein